MSIDRIAVIEQSLGVKLPLEYAAFISEKGFDEVNTMEIYGYIEDMSDVNKIPCVIGATRLYRTLYDLADHEIVLAATGYEDILVILDTVNGKVSEIGYDGRKCIASSFEIWRRGLKKPDKTIS